jgi:uncharacterized protein
MKVYDKIILKYYPKDTKRYHYYYTHCKTVTELALKVAQLNPQYNADLDYIETASMLHDIGIFLTHAPAIGCYGKEPYLKHGFMGRELLEKEGLPEIAPICERHIGTGITLEEIELRSLPFPKRDMTPQTIEEKIICYADKFYSKSAEDLTMPKPIEKIRRKLLKHGYEKMARFDAFVEMFGSEYVYE